MATDLKEIRFRLSEKELSRIEQLKKEFSFKSRSRLVRLLVTCSAEKLEDKIHVIPEEFGKEIHDAILAIAKDIHDTKLNLQRMGNNINQMAKATNVAKKSGAVVGTATYEIQQPQHHLERGEEYARIMKRDAEDFIQKYKKYYLANDTLYMKTYADFIHEYCANADEIIANIHQNAHAATVQNPVSVTVDFDTEQIEKLIERLDKASEELGQLLWQIK